MFDELIPELALCPTVEAGIILVITRIRWAVEARNRDLNDAGLRELTIELNERCADLADAIVRDTPAEQASRAAAVEQAETP